MYFPPFIDAAGLHIPTYNDIKLFLLDEARSIFGADIYLENDSQDYELISIMAARHHDTFLALQLIYNNRGPATAIGGALDGIVKLNGIKRKPATYSTCVVELTGDAGTEIINGIVMDEQNINWDLQSPITISETGNAYATATCQRLGPIFAGAGQLNQIGTPTAGWQSVTNHEAAVMGLSVESQEELRARQTISTANPSRTVLEGTSGAIAAVADVTRHRVYENDTNILGYYGPPVPGHSISAIVEGGNDYAIAYAIYIHKTPGCGTFGDVEIAIEHNINLNIDEAIIAEMTDEPPIKFFRPTYVDIWATITVKRLPGYVSQITDDIIRNAADYLNSLRIGDNLTLSALWGAALAAMPDIRRPLFSIVSVTAGTEESAQDDIDIEIPFNSVTRGDESQINVVFA